MNALRSAAFVVWLAVTVVPWALAVLAASLVAPSRTIYAMCAGWLRVAILGARAICGVDWRVHGMERLPTASDARAAVLLASKHQSTWETFAYPVVMPHPLAYVFKRELLWVPFFGWAMSRMDMVHIDRGRRAEAWAKVQSQGRRIMAGGTWVIMFPEGTRIARGAKGEYKHGAARLAIACGVPIVPIAVNSARCWPRKSWVLRPGVVDISIGPPIDPTGRDPAHVTADVEAWIEDEMRRLDPEAYVPGEPTPVVARRPGAGG